MSMNILLQKYFEVINRSSILHMKLLYVMNIVDNKNWLSF